MGLKKKAKTVRLSAGKRTPVAISGTRTKVTGLDGSPVYLDITSGIVPPNGGTWQEFVDGLDDAATPAKYNHHWS